MIQKTIEVSRYGLAHKKFFEPLSNMTTYDSPARALGSEQLLSPACRSRTELIPRHTRAKTISGKWKYLLEYSAGPVQNVQVNIVNKNVMFQNGVKLQIRIKNRNNTESLLIFITDGVL